MAAWVQVGWQALRFGTRRRVWPRRATAAVVFSFVFIWAAVAPQGSLSLGERLRFGCDALTVVCLIVAGTSGLRGEYGIPAEVDSHLSWETSGLARLFARGAVAVEELLPAIPFFLLLAALEVITAWELFGVLRGIILAIAVAALVSNARLAITLIAITFVCALGWRRNAFETSLIGLLAAHVATKAWLGWKWTHATRRCRANLLHELATPISASELSRIYRSRAWKENSPALTALTAANVLAIGLLVFGTHVPATMEQKFALCLALTFGIGLLFLDAAALFWAGLVAGIAREDGPSSFSKIYGVIMGVPWAAAWAFSALHSGETVTLNETAAYFVLWTILGGSVSWVVATRSRSRFEREVRWSVFEA